MRGIGTLPGWREEDDFDMNNKDGWIWRLKAEFPGDDFYGEEDEYTDSHAVKAVDHRRHMFGHEVGLLLSIHENGTALDPNEYHRHFTDCPDTQHKEVLAFWHDIRLSRLYEGGYIEMNEPRRRNGHWQIDAEVTRLGYKAILCAENDLLWHMGHRRADLKQSVEMWRERLNAVTFPGEDVFGDIEQLRSHVYGELRALIPTYRAKVWRERMSTSNWPFSHEWDRFSDLDLPGLKQLLPHIDGWRHDSWLRALRNARGYQDNIFEKAFETTGDDYADVRAQALESHIEAWVAKVQTITDPKSPLFKQVDALPETYSLVKAEAFHQKMKCWTPLDNKGRRV